MKKNLSLLVGFMLFIFANQAMATSVIGKVWYGSDGAVLLIPTTYLYVGSAPGSELLPELGCVKVDGILEYSFEDGINDAKFTSITSVEILKDSACEGIE